MDAYPLAVKFAVENFDNPWTPEQLKALETYFAVTWRGAHVKVYKMLREWPYLTDPEREKMLRFNVDEDDQRGLKGH